MDLERAAVHGGVVHRNLKHELQLLGHDGGILADVHDDAREAREAVFRHRLLCDVKDLLGNGRLVHSVLLRLAADVALAHERLLERLAEEHAVAVDHLAHVLRALRDAHAAADAALILHEHLAGLRVEAGGHGRAEVVADVAAVAVFRVDDDGLCVRAHIQRLHAAARVRAEHLAALRVAVADGGRFLVHVAGVVEHLMHAALLLAVDEDLARLSLADLAADTVLDDLLGDVADAQADLIRRGVLGLQSLSAADVAAEAVHDAYGRIVRQAVEIRLELVARHDARRVVGELAVHVHDLAGGLALERERDLHVTLVALELVEIVHDGVARAQRLDVERGDHVDGRGEQLRRLLQRLIVLARRERKLKPARQHRREVERRLRPVVDLEQEALAAHIVERGVPVAARVERAQLRLGVAAQLHAHHDVVLFVGHEQLAVFFKLRHRRLRHLRDGVHAVHELEIFQITHLLCSPFRQTALPTRTAARRCPGKLAHTNLLYHLV